MEQIEFEFMMKYKYNLAVEEEKLKFIFLHGAYM
jgi:hypothetical protein